LEVRSQIVALQLNFELILREHLLDKLRNRIAKPHPNTCFLVQEALLTFFDYQEYSTDKTRFQHNQKGAKPCLQMLQMHVLWGC
jgi:hypothetical protein